MLRNARQEKILELIEEQEIETQEELCEQLAASHFNVTQATVSRDIKQLRLFKVAGTNKRYRYAAVREGTEDLCDRLGVLFRACVEELFTVKNQIVIKTLSGNASNAGAVIDRIGYREVVGTIAGDDTVLVVCTDDEGARLVGERLQQMVYRT